MDETLYHKIEVKEETPKLNGCFDTDKGFLYWNRIEKMWSLRPCCDSEEYPTWWLKPHSVDADELYIKYVKFVTEKAPHTIVREGDLIFNWFFEQFRLIKQPKSPADKSLF